MKPNVETLLRAMAERPRDPEYWGLTARAIGATPGELGEAMLRRVRAAETTASADHEEA